MAKIKITEGEFLAALRRAEQDDVRWPWLRSVECLNEMRRSKVFSVAAGQKFAVHEEFHRGEKFKDCPFCAEEIEE